MYKCFFLDVESTKDHKKQHANRLGQILRFADSPIDAKAVYLMFLCLLYYVCSGQQCFHVGLGRENRYESWNSLEGTGSWQTNARYMVSSFIFDWNTPLYLVGFKGFSFGL